MKRFAFLLLAVAMATLALATPALAAQTAPQAQVSFGESIDVRVVNVEAVVTDRQGKRVPGLTAADFRLLVDGREVPVDYFTEVRGGEAAPAREGAPAPATAVGPGEAVGTNYLVYIDDQFSIPAPRNMVLRRLASDLRRMGPQDSMTILSFDGFKLKRLSDWSNDRQILTQAFTKAEETPAFGIAMRAAQESDKYTQLGCPLNPKSVAAAMSMGMGMEIGMRALVAAMRGTLAPPGRKVLLFLNGGWPLPEPPQEIGAPPSAIDFPEAEKVFAPVYDTANLLGYTLYPIQVHGMMFMDSLWNEARMPIPMPHDFILSSIEQSEQYDLEVLARETGGKALLNSAKLDAFTRVTADTSSYYWLGFTPEWRADGSRHAIKVEARRPGLAVRSRTGFSDLSRETEEQVQAESLLLFSSPELASLMVTPGALRRVSYGLRELPVTVEIPAAAFSALPAEAGWALNGSLSIAVLLKGFETPYWKTLPLHLELSQLPPEGGRAPWQTVLKLPRSAGKLFFALSDEHGVRSWTQLDLQHLAPATPTKGEK